MSKAEEFIREHIRNCSNIMDGYYPSGKQAYFPWLTPDQARRAVEIAKEEVIEKFICWLKDNFRDDAGLCCIISDFDTTKEMYNNLKQAMKDE